MNSDLRQLDREIDRASRRRYFRQPQPMTIPALFFWTFALAVGLILLAMIFNGVFK